MLRANPLPVPLLAALFALVTLAWWLPNRPRAGDVDMPAARFNSVSFAPFRAGQSPLTGRFPSAAEVERDIALIAPSVRAIRTYAAIEGDYDVAAIAQRHGLKLWQGIWLGGDRAQNAREIRKAVELARRYPDTVERVVVGNEVLLRRDLPVDELIADIDAVKASVTQPVTYADVWEFWRQFPQVAPHVDIVTIHLLPYWEDAPTGIDRAVAHVGAVYREMAARFPEKPVAIGETGWPSRGRWRDNAAPGVVNEAVFLRRFVSLAQAEHFDYNLIEAFDQIWKYQSEGIVGANWGIWTADRRPKFPLAGPVVENPRWPVDAAVSCGLACCFLGFGLLVAGGHPASSPRLAMLATALGAALGFAWASATPDLDDTYVRVAAIGNLLGQSVLAMLLMARAAQFPSRGSAPAARTGADATNTVRNLLRGRLPPPTAWFDDLTFLFVWTAAVLQLLLVFDPRYRDFPFGAFGVPLVATLARAIARDLPRAGGQREELLAGGVLALGAIASAIREGPRNHQALAWSVCALILAAPPLLRCVGTWTARRC